MVPAENKSRPNCGTVKSIFLHLSQTNCKYYWEGQEKFLKDLLTVMVLIQIFSYIFKKKVFESYK